MIGAITAGLLSGGVAASTNSYESIQTTTVGSGGSASISFSSIPSTYKHLQIRGIAQDNRATYNSSGFNMRLNGDTGANYSWHWVQASWVAGATTAMADAGASATNMNLMGSIVSSVATNVFGAFVIDVLEYTNTNIYKTVRGLSGGDANAEVSGYRPVPRLASGSWRSTSAVTSITLYPEFGTQFNQYSSFALYGIKG